MRLKFFQSKTNYANTVNVMPTTSEFLQQPSLLGGANTEPRRGKAGRARSRTLTHVIQMFEEHQPQPRPTSTKSSHLTYSEYCIKANGAVAARRPCPDKVPETHLRTKARPDVGHEQPATPAAADPLLAYIDTYYPNPKSTLVNTTPSSPILSTALSPPPRRAYTQHVHHTRGQRKSEPTESGAPGECDASRIAKHKPAIAQHTPQDTLPRRHPDEHKLHSSSHRDTSARVSFISATQKLQVLVDEIEAAQALDDTPCVHDTQLALGQVASTDSLQDCRASTTQQEQAASLTCSSNY